MKVLVTGANGQLGCSLRKMADQVGHDVPGAPSVMPDLIGHLSWVFTDVEELDITDLAAIRKMVADEGINVIVNCAGYTNVEAAEDNPDFAEKLNAEAVGNLATAMKEVGGLLIHISTDYVYGGKPLCTPISEDETPAPQGVYAVTKLHGEEAIRRIGCRHIIIRTAWLYSEFGKNFVKTMLRLTAEKPTLKVVNDQRGTPTYAGDLANVIVRLLSDINKLEVKGRVVGKAEEGEEFSGASALYFASEKSSPSSANENGIFHYTNEGECTWYEFAKTIAEYAGHTSCDIQPCTSDEFPSKVHRPAYSVLDKGKIKSALGISIPHWTDSLKICLKALI